MAKRYTIENEERSEKSASTKVPTSESESLSEGNVSLEDRTQRNSALLNVREGFRTEGNGSAHRQRNEQNPDFSAEINAIEGIANALERIATALEKLTGNWEIPLLRPEEEAYTVGEPKEPTEAEIQAEIEKLRKLPDCENISEDELRRKAIKILEDDIPF